MRMRAPVLVLAICLLSALHMQSVAGSAVDVHGIIEELLNGGDQGHPDLAPAVSLITIDETSHPVLLERRSALFAMGPKCNKAKFCPLQKGVCCRGGQACCPDKCVGSGSEARCSRSAMQQALAIAKMKMQEEGKKQLKYEASKKGKTEAGVKNRQEEARKNRSERKRKNEKSGKEVRKKTLRARQEADKKSKDKANESYNKKKETRRKASERKTKRSRAESRKKGLERKGKSEKKKKAHRRRLERARKDKRKRQEKKSKERKAKGIRREKDRKRKSRERRGKSAEKRRKREVKTLRSTNFIPRKNKVLAPASSVKNRNMFTYMFWLRVEGTSNHWTQIFQKGSNPRMRNPAMWLYPGRTRLHIRSGVKGSWNNGADPRKHLSPWKWYHIGIVHGKGKMEVYINSRRVLKKNVGPPLMNGSPLYATRRGERPAAVTMSDFKYMPNIAGAAKRIKQAYRRRRYKRHKNKARMIRAKHWTPKRNKLLVRNHFIKKARMFSYMLWVKPQGISRHWSQIFHKGNSNYHRNPAVWFYPGRTKLHIRIGSRRSWNDGGDPHQSLKLHRWSHVVLAQREPKMKVWYNGRKVIDRRTYMPRENNGHLWGCSRYYTGAKAIISQFIHVNGMVSQSDVNKAYRQRKHGAVKNRKIVVVGRRMVPRRGHIAKQGRSFPKSNERTIMFWVNQRNRKRGWQNLFHKGASNGQRAPAVWIYPHRRRLHIRSGSTRHTNDGHDPRQNIGWRRWTHVAFAHRQGKFKVWYNGRLVVHVRKAGPISNNGPMYVCDPWHGHTRAVISNLQWHTTFLSDRKVKAEYRRKNIP